MDFRKARFFILYLLFGLIAGITHVVFHADSVLPVVGASGAVAGLLGAYLVLYPQNKVKVLYFYVFTTELQAWVYLGFWFLMQAVNQAFAKGSPVAYLAHIGGFVAGIFVAVAMKAYVEKNPRLD